MSIMKSQNLYNYLDFNVTTKKNEKKWDAFGSGHSCSKGRWHYPVQLVLLILIHWIEIYPMNNWGKSYSKFEKFRPYEKQSQAAFSSRYVVRHDYSAFLRWII